MFRLVSFEEGSELYKYLSSISSRTIYDALCEWVYSPVMLEEICQEHFDEKPGSSVDKGYFDGSAAYLHRKEPDDKFSGWFSKWDYRPGLSEDEEAAMEFIWRKTERMKDKMLDPDEYYTFDLFEEYLFTSMISDMAAMNEAAEDIPDEGFPIGDLFGGEVPTGEPDEDQIRQAFANYLGRTVSRLTQIADKENEIEKTKEELVRKHGFDEEEAGWTAEAVHDAASMMMEDAEDAGYVSPFFWDDDCQVFFGGSDTFIDAVHGIIGGAGAALGYGYGDVARIFTDAGYYLPLRLIGTETAYDLRKEAFDEKIRQMPEPLPPNDIYPDSADTDNDADLPFS